MTEGTGKLIAFLLAAILAVMLFGREAVTGTLSVVFWVCVGLFALFIGLLFIKGMFAPIYEEGVAELRKAKVENGPVFSTIFCYVSIALNIIVGLWAAVLWWDNGGGFKSNLSEIPLYWLPISAFAVSWPLMWCERKARALFNKQPVAPRQEP